MMDESGLPHISIRIGSGLLAFAVSFVLTTLTMRALKTGRISFQSWSADRATDPLVFWIQIIGFSASALISLHVGVKAFTQSAWH